MQGVPASAIQALAGHADLCTTQRYMHLAPSALDDAIATLGTLLENAAAPAPIPPPTPPDPALKPAETPGFGHSLGTLGASETISAP